MSEPVSTPDHPIPLAARLLAAVISLVVSGLGVLSVETGHHAGRTKQGALRVLDGEPALLFGLGLALMGLAPLALWQRTPARAGWWAAVCLVGGVGLMLAAGRA